MKVRILDSINFYAGKTAQVLESTRVGDVTVFWVRVDGTNIEMAIRADKTEDVYV